jgi:hypothetical protein
MPDYYPLLTRALAGLDPNTDEARQAVYDRARQALLKQLRGVSPPLAEAEVTRERLALEDAIKRADSEVVRKEEAAAAKQAPAGPPPLRTRQPQRPPVPLRPPVRMPPSDRPRLPGEGAKAPADQPPRPGRAPGARAMDLDSVGDAGPPPAAEAPAAADEQPRPRPLRVGSGRIMRDGQRRAMQARMLVGGLIVVLLLVAVGLGYMNRGRILALLGIGPGATVTTDVKAPDRVATEPAATPAPAPAPAPPGAVPPVGQRAVLYEENPAGGEQLQTFVGTAVWRTETVSPGPGQPPDIGLRAEIQIPDRNMSAVVTIRRNPDRNLPASHTIEVQFSAPNDPFGGVASTPGMRLKSSETAQGLPLAGLVVKVMPGFFLIGLSAVDADREQNLQLLRERTWFDVPFVYNNGRRAVLAFEKGTPGERAVNEALAAWSK